MYIKRVIDQNKVIRNLPGQDGRLRDPTQEPGVVLEVLDDAVKGVRILHAGPVQKFTERVLIRGQEEGWLHIDGGNILIEGEQGVLIYHIDRTPGYICCFCEATHEEDGEEMQAHVARLHTLPSPDPCNPAGYRLDNFYFCTRKD